MPRPSRPRRRALLALAVATSVALAGVAGCGGDDDVTNEQFSEDLRERIPENVASDDVIKCLTDGIFDAFPAETRNEIYTAVEETDLDKATRTEIAEINEACYSEAAADDKSDKDKDSGDKDSGDNGGGASSSSTTTAPARSTEAPPASTAPPG